MCTIRLPTTARSQYKYYKLKLKIKGNWKRFKLGGEHNGALADKEMDFSPLRSR